MLDFQIVGRLGEQQRHGIDGIALDPGRAVGADPEARLGIGGHAGSSRHSAHIRFASRARTSRHLRQFAVVVGNEAPGPVLDRASWQGMHAAV
jgi:hypothetical protein